MSQPPPYTSQPMPYGDAGYHPQNTNPYYNQGGAAPYPQGYYNGQPQVIYVQEPRRQQAADNNCWLTSLLALCCGCFIGEVCCDSPMLCCIIPCPIRCPRFP
ncbi:unnamed protein product [Caenorhabditis auriculariae]|uniref:Cysteine-rich transmembrane CYSTM domain-containing protein n=1 Tax=Caenorhabditis auriculariae TaxID=2777116 RepID=A0A8S1HTL4_9PELO|nr:unnamed protein product [Caenorhabditis auriculariae]